MVASDSDENSDFRERLRAIPKIDEQPLDDDWSTATPPVVRPPAPVARPVTNRNAKERRDTAEIAVPASSDGRRYVIDEPPVTNDRSGHHGGQDHIEVVAPRLGRRRRWPIVMFFLLLILALAVVIPLFIANRTFNAIERVELGDALTQPLAEGTNVLLVGTDSRAGVDADEENAEVIFGEGIAGARTDTIMVLRIEEEQSKFLSLPRDLWLPINGGDPQRINTAFAQGPDALVNTVQSELGIPISHYAEVDLAGFIELVDAVDGVEITIPNPAFDRASGLDLPSAGTVVLDSTQALAYVRSRNYTEIVDGAEVRDLSSDLGRVQRQQTFLRALMQKVSAQRNPATLNSMTAAIADALIIDDETSLTGALGLANALRAASPESVTLPTMPERINGAAVLTLTNEAPAVLAQFGGR